MKDINYDLKKYFSFINFTSLGKAVHSAKYCQPKTDKKIAQLEIAIVVFITTH